MSGIQRDVGPASARWDFHTWDQCGKSEDARNFADRNAAAFWLMQFKSDPFAMANLRTLAASSSDAGFLSTRSSDDQVLERLSRSLVQGVLHVHSFPAPATAFRSGQQSSAAAEKVLPVARPTRSSQRSNNQPQTSIATLKAPDDADTFTSSTDGAATAAVLRSAAVSGVPFCEECAKAAAAKRAA